MPNTFAQGCMFFVSESANIKYLRKKCMPSLIKEY